MNIVGISMGSPGLGKGAKGINSIGPNNIAKIKKLIVNKFKINNSI